MTITISWGVNEPDFWGFRKKPPSIYGSISVSGNEDVFGCGVGISGIFPGGDEFNFSIFGGWDSVNNQLEKVYSEFERHGQSFPGIRGSQEWNFKPDYNAPAPYSILPALTVNEYLKLIAPGKTPLKQSCLSMVGNKIVPNKGRIEYMVVFPRWDDPTVILQTNSQGKVLQAELRRGQHTLMDALGKPCSLSA